VVRVWWVGGWVGVLVRPVVCPSVCLVARLTTVAKDVHSVTPAWMMKYARTIAACDVQAALLIAMH